MSASEAESELGRGDGGVFTLFGAEAEDAVSGFGDHFLK